MLKFNGRMCVWGTVHWPKRNRWKIVLKLELKLSLVKSYTISLQIYLHPPGCSILVGLCRKTPFLNCNVCILSVHFLMTGKETLWLHGPDCWVEKKEIKRYRQSPIFGPYRASQPSINDSSSKQEAIDRVHLIDSVASRSDVVHLKRNLFECACVEYG